MRKYNSNYKYRISSQTEKSIFLCAQCPFTTKAKVCLKNHIIFKHTPVENVHWYNCPSCPYRARTKNHLKVHLASFKHCRPEDAIWHQCPHCPYRVRSKKSFKLHMTRNKHEFKTKIDKDQLKWFACEFCLYLAKEEGDLQKHLVEQHQLTEILWLNCPYCSYKTLGVSNLTRHIIFRHDTVQKAVFSCPRCMFKTEEETVFKQHVINKDRCNVGDDPVLQVRQETVENNKVFQEAYTEDNNIRFNAKVKRDCFMDGFNGYSCSKCMFKTKEILIFKQHLLKHIC